MSEEPGMTVTAAIIIEDGRVLISECLARELAEELGVTVEVGKAVGRVRHSYPDLVIDLLAYEAAITMGTLEDIECSAHMWALPSELEEYDLLPPDRRLARDIFGIRE